MRRPTLLVLPALVTLAACGAPGTEVGPALAQPIVGGTPDPGDPAVVLLLARVGSSTASCTATVVSSRVILTAAHCVHPDKVGSGARFQVFLGDDHRDAAQARDAGNYMDVVETHYHLQYDPSIYAANHDIAVAITRSPLYVSPVPMNRAPVGEDRIGGAIRVIGFGLASGNDPTGATLGLKRELTTQITYADETQLGYGDSAHSICPGDSGGPALVTVGGFEYVAAVNSYGGRGCQYGGAGTRVDAFAASFVDPFIARFRSGGSSNGGGGGGDDGGCSVTPGAASRGAGAPLFVALLVLVVVGAAVARRRRA